MFLALLDESVVRTFQIRLLLHEFEDPSFVRQRRGFGFVRHLFVDEMCSVYARCSFGQPLWWSCMRGYESHWWNALFGDDHWAAGVECTRAARRRRLKMPAAWAKRFFALASCNTLANRLSDLFFEILGLN